MADNVLDRIDTMLARLQEPYPDTAAWYEWRRRSWIDGVKIAREVAARELKAIRSAYLLGDGDRRNGDRRSQPERRAGGDRRKAAGQ